MTKTEMRELLADELTMQLPSLVRIVLYGPRDEKDGELMLTVLCFCGGLLMERQNERAVSNPN